MELSGVPEKKFRSISSSIDKLDKMEWGAVRHEMVVEKSLDAAAADALEGFVQISGSPREIWNQLTDSGRFTEHKTGSKALAEMGTLITYCECLGIEDRLSFDLSLARGLDYYTGLIYEAVLVNNEFGVGSIAGGGRYDELIMRLNNSKTATPSVGVSIGIERVISILEKKQDKVHENRILVA
jgi:histidyl-tRNA synthetase